MRFLTVAILIFLGSWLLFVQKRQTIIGLVFVVLGILAAIL